MELTVAGADAYTPKCWGDPECTVADTPSTNERVRAMDDADIVSAVSAIYEVALEPARWVELLDRLSAMIDAPQASLLFGSDDLKFSEFGVRRNPEAIALYNEVFGPDDPWYKVVPTYPKGAVLTGQQLKPTREFEHTPYFNDCQKVGDIYDCLGGFLDPAEDNKSIVCFYRPKGREFFGERERRLFAAFQPHLARMTRIQGEIQASRARTNQLSGALHRLRTGIVVVASAGVVFANAAAEAIFARTDGLALTSRRPKAAVPEEDARLDEALRRALAPPWAARRPRQFGPIGSTLTVSRGQSSRGYVLHVMPLAADFGADATLAAPDPSAVIAITDPAARAEPTAEIVRRVLGLTATESRFVITLARGGSIKETAEVLDMTENTGRWHFKNIKSKVGVEHHSDLVRLIASLAPELAEQD